MIPRKIDHQTASAIKSLFQKQNTNDARVLIDLEKQTVEAPDEDYSMDDLLEAAGTLSPERGREPLAEVKRSREEWDV